MKKKIIIPTSIAVFVLIVLTGLGLYSLEVRQEYQYVISYKPDEQSRNTVDELKKKMRELGYKNEHGFLIKEGRIGGALGTMKRFINSGPDYQGNYNVGLIYGYNGSWWDIAEQKKDYDRICDEIITPAISKLKVTYHGDKDGVLYNTGKRYKIFWCIEFD